MLYADPTGIRNKSRNWSFVRFHTSILDGDMESPQRYRSASGPRRFNRSLALTLRRTCVVR